MSYYIPKVPRVVVKPKEMNSWSPRMKVLAVLLALVLYVYLLLVLKTIYSKSKRLDRIMTLAMETEKQMLNMHTIDQSLGMKMEPLDNMFEGY